MANHQEFEYEHDANDDDAPAGAGTVGVREDFSRFHATPLRRSRFGN
jgi:hypothetical protein